MYTVHVYIIIIIRFRITIITCMFMFLCVYAAGTSSRPSTPSASAARTPGEIVASALRNRSRPSGVLRKAIGMYQENKRQSLQVRKTLQENKCHSSFMEELEEREDMENDDLNVPEMKKRERVSSSAGKNSYSK